MPNLLATTTIGNDVAVGGVESFTYDLDISGLTTPIDVFAVVNDPGFAMANLPYDFETDFPVTGTGECLVVVAAMGVLLHL